MKGKYGFRFTALVLVVFTFLSSCSKDGAEPGDGLGNGGIPLPADLEGTLLYDWVDEGLLAVNVKTGVKSVFITDNIRGHGYDVSVMASSGSPQAIYRETMMLRNIR